MSLGPILKDLKNKEDKMRAATETHVCTRPNDLEIKAYTSYTCDDCGKKAVATEGMDSQGKPMISWRNLPPS